MKELRMVVSDDEGAEKARPRGGTQVTPPTELEAFHAVCQRLGLRVTIEPKGDDGFFFLECVAPTVSQQAHWCLALGQNYLYFDLQGRFLGTLGDENGAWEPRETFGERPGGPSPSDV